LDSTLGSKQDSTRGSTTRSATPDSTLAIDREQLAAEFDRALDEAHVRYILLDEPGDIEALRAMAGNRLRPLHRAVAGGREAWVFERVGSATR
jgi:hypothetical protein